MRKTLVFVSKITLDLVLTVLSFCFCKFTNLTKEFFFVVGYYLFMDLSV